MTKLKNQLYMVTRLWNIVSREIFMNGSLSFNIRGPNDAITVFDTYHHDWVSRNDSSGNSFCFLIGFDGSIQIIDEQKYLAESTSITMFTIANATTVMDAYLKNKVDINVLEEFKQLTSGECPKHFPAHANDYQLVFISHKE